MKISRSHGWRPAVAATALLVLGAAPALAQTALSCNDFARNPAGNWRVLGPVMLELNGRLYSPIVGTVFPAGATRNGVEMSDVLDRQCGNR
jgi:hypothetical protein